MKRFAFLFLTLFLVQSTTAQTFFRPADTLYVWAKSGLNMREFPVRDSKKIKSIPFSEKVVAIGYDGGGSFSQLISEKETLFKDTPSPVKAPAFSLIGLWLKVKHGNDEGYVFDAYLSSLPLPKLEMQTQVMRESGKALEFIRLKEKPQEYLARVFGQSKVTVINKTENPESTTTLVQYKNGASYRKEIWGSAGAMETIVIPELSLNEGYQLFNLIFNYEVLSQHETDDIMYPIEIEDSKLRFWTGGPEGEATVLWVGGFLILTWFNHC